MTSSIDQPNLPTQNQNPIDQDRTAPTPVDIEIDTNRNRLSNNWLISNENGILYFLILKIILKLILSQESKLC